MELALKCESPGALRWVARSGQVRMMALPGGWLAVSETQRPSRMLPGWTSRGLGRSSRGGWNRTDGLDAFHGDVGLVRDNASLTGSRRFLLRDGNSGMAGGGDQPGNESRGGRSGKGTICDTAFGVTIMGELVRRPTAKSCTVAVPHAKENRHQ